MKTLLKILNIVYFVLAAAAIACFTVNFIKPDTIPFLKIDGVLISMKGSKALEEIKESESILKDIGAKVEKIIPYTVLDRSYNLVLIKKIKDTPKKYLKNKKQG